jgi:hypothetical protein
MSKFKVGEMAYIKPEITDSRLINYIDVPLTITSITYCGYKFKEIPEVVLGKELDRPNLWRERQLNKIFDV